MNQNRRQFLKRSSMAAAAVMLLPSCVGGVENELISKIGLQLYTVRDQMKADALGTLKRIAEIGYKKIEMAGYDDGKMYGFEPYEFKNILDDLGMDLISGHIKPLIFDSGFSEALEACAKAGQKYMVMPYLDVPQENPVDFYKSVADLLNLRGEEASKSGMRVCYHNHAFEFDEVDGQIPMNILIENIDSQYVSLETDLYWISKAGFDPIAFFEKNKGQAELWHVKDMKESDKSFTEVGEGVIDYSHIFRKKDVAGMKYFFVEQDRSPDPMKSIEISYNNLITEILA